MSIPSLGPGGRSRVGRCGALALLAVLAVGTSRAAADDLLPLTLGSISPVTLGSRTSAAVSLDGEAYFFATDVAHGSELWRTDGTPDGTELFDDINPGTASGAGRSLATGGPILAATPSDVYFLADDGTHGTELWATDGTTGGTRMLDDLAPGLESSQIYDIHASGTAVYLVARTGSDPVELWRTDGTPAGTQQVNTAPTYSGYSSMIPWGDGGLLFAVNSNLSTVASQLWVTDGTAAGTQQLTHVSASPIDNAFPVVAVIGSKALFELSDADHGRQLWSTDGTPGGTQFVADVAPPDASGGLTSAIAVIGGVGYVSTKGGLWRSDGTPAGTTMVKSFVGLWPTDPVAAGGRLFFFVGNTLWTSDGTETGTASIEDVSGVLAGEMAIGSRFVFGAGANLWWSDGTLGGTSSVALPNEPVAMGQVGGKAIFADTDGTTGLEPWASDSTPSGTRLLKDIDLESDDAIVSGIADAGGRAVLVAHDRLGYHLVISDGTQDGAHPVAGVTPASPGEGPVFGVIGGQALFAGTDAAHGSELWVTDGTAPGTHLLADLMAGTAGSNPSGFQRVGSAVYFTAFDGVHGIELWRSDGTAEGTRLVTDIVPGASSSFATIIGATTDAVYFGATSPDTGPGLWRSDGTPAGTSFVKDIGGIFRLLTGPHVAYALTDAGYWRTDGTSEGTSLVKPRGENEAWGPAAMLGDDLFLLIPDSAGDTGLWKVDGSGAQRIQTLGGLAPISEFTTMFGAGHALLISDGTTVVCSDGTAAPFQPVLDIDSLHSNTLRRSTLGDFTVLDGQIYFRVGDLSPQPELVGTDGTAAGTHVISDHAPRPASDLYPDPQPMAAVGDRLVFPYGIGSHWLATVGPVNANPSDPHCAPAPAPATTGGGFVHSFPTPPRILTSFPAPPKPQITHLVIAPRVFAAAHSGATLASAPRGAALSIGVSSLAEVRFVIFRSSAGVRSRGKCVARAPGLHGSECTRLVRVGAVRRILAGGTSRLRFTARFGGRPLGPARYEMTAVPVNGVGTGSLRRAPFRIVLAPRRRGR